MNVNVTQLIQERQNQFIEKRTIIESEVNKFLQSLERLDADIKVRCKVVDGRTCHDVLPSLWIEPFNEENYLKEKEVLDNYISQVKIICDELNQEALTCLQS